MNTDGPLMMAIVALGLIGSSAALASCEGPTQVVEVTVPSDYEAAVRTLGAFYCAEDEERQWGSLNRHHELVMAMVPGVEPLEPCT